MVKQLVEAQLYNSIWKILKMRLAYRYVPMAVFGGLVVDMTTLLVLVWVLLLQVRGAQCALVWV